jgi:hypothetical protein
MKTLLANLGVTSIIAVFIALIAVIVLFPLAVVWALNTLFALGIAYSFWTWLAVLILGLFIRPYVRKQ